MINAGIGDTELAVMCDIARASGGDLAGDKLQILQRLIAAGLVEPAKDRKAIAGGAYAVTSRGQRLLDNHGVGVNEA